MWLSDFRIVSSISTLSFITVTNRTPLTRMVATTSFSLSDGQEIYSCAFTRITHPHQSCVGSWIGVPVTLGGYSMVPCRGKHQSEPDPCTARPSHLDTSVSFFGRNSVCIVQRLAVFLMAHATWEDHLSESSLHYIMT